jgi:hypothetical protein
VEKESRVTGCSSAVRYAFFLQFMADFVLHNSPVKYYNQISNVANDDRQQTEYRDADKSAFP